jgi:hypothetical protein
MRNHNLDFFPPETAHIFSKMSCVLKAVQDITGTSIVLWTVQAFKVGTCLHFFPKTAKFSQKNGA